MTCKEFRKFLYAFADGELETRENLEVLEHLNMCPRCAQKVAVQQELRAAVARVCRPEPAPAALRERVIANLKRSPARLRWRRRLVVFAPLAAAAMIALVFLFPADDSALAKAVAEKHRMCCDHLDMHHNEGLPKDLSAGEKLSEQLAFKVLARSFGGSGYRFHSASICELGEVRSGHLIYQEPKSGALLSAFSVPQTRFGGTVVSRDGHDFHLLDAEGYGIVAWNGDGASHLVCAERGSQEVLKLVTTPPVAMRPVERSPIVFAAFHEPLDR